MSKSKKYGGRLAGHNPLCDGKTIMISELKWSADARDWIGAYHGFALFMLIQKGNSYRKTQGSEYSPYNVSKDPQHKIFWLGAFKIKLR